MLVEVTTPGFANADEALPPEIQRLLAADLQRGMPALAKSPSLCQEVEERLPQMATVHRLHLCDARELDFLADESVHLVVTSPPYWTLKEYEHTPGQLGHIDDYDAFLDELDRVWAQVLRALVPGGRLVVVVGDVCVPRRRFGRHVVFPLHAGIQEHCRRLGFDNLTPILWHKITNAKLEVNGPGGFLGKPYEPNGVIKNDFEFILFQRKPGGYRKPSLAEKGLSVIPAERHREWFQSLWRLSGASTREHPAPFPLSLAERLVRMFSFVGDTVLDPFCGTGTTNLAARRWGRHSVGVEITPSYHRLALARLQNETLSLPLAAAGG